MQINGEKYLSSTDVSKNYQLLTQTVPPVVLTEKADQQLKIAAQQRKINTYFVLGMVACVVAGYVIYKRASAMSIEEQNAKMLQMNARTARATLLENHPGRLDMEKIMQVAREQNVCPCALKDKMSTPALEEYLKLRREYIPIKPREINMEAPFLGVGASVTITAFIMCTLKAFQTNSNANSAYRSANEDLAEFYKDIKSKITTTDKPQQERFQAIEVQLVKTGIRQKDTKTLVDLLKA